MSIIETEMYLTYRPAPIYGAQLVKAPMWALIAEHDWNNLRRAFLNMNQRAMSHDFALKNTIKN